jgi:hypothetical protein
MALGSTERSQHIDLLQCMWTWLHQAEAVQEAEDALKTATRFIAAAKALAGSESVRANAASARAAVACQHAYNADARASAARAEIDTLRDRAAKAEAAAASATKHAVQADVRASAARAELTALSDRAKKAEASAALAIQRADNADARALIPTAKGLREDSVAKMQAIETNPGKHLSAAQKRNCKERYAPLAIVPPRAAPPGTLRSHAVWPSNPDI